MSAVVHAVADEIRRRQEVGEPTRGWSVPGAPRPVDAPLPERELVLAAKFFTVSNLGGAVPPAPRTVAQIERAYAKCRDDHGCEGVDIVDEYRDWVATFRKRDAYAMTTWAKDAETITDIASVRTALAGDVR